MNIEPQTIVLILSLILLVYAWWVLIVSMRKTRAISLRTNKLALKTSSLSLQMIPTYYSARFDKEEWEWVMREHNIEIPLKEKEHE